MMKEDLRQWILSSMMKFKLYYLLLLSSLPDTWTGMVTTVTSSAGPDGFTFEKIRDLILGEDVQRWTFGELSSESLSVCVWIGE